MTEEIVLKIFLTLIIIGVAGAVSMAIWVFAP